MFDKYENFFSSKQLNLNPEYYPENLFLDDYDHSDWYKKWQKKELVDISPIRPTENDKETDNVPTMPPLDGDEEEAKERKWIKFLTPNKYKLAITQT